MKEILIAGNWKMNTNLHEAEWLASEIVSGLQGRTLRSGVLICPPFTNLTAVSHVIKGSDIRLGAQNCWHMPSGAFTGEISINMLEQAGCSHVIIGHSERRTIFRETDAELNLKLKSILLSRLEPILCIGETLDERREGKTFSVIDNQISKAFSEIGSADLERVTIAYEPVWAIGTGVSATPAQAQEAHSWIRKYLRENYGETAEGVKILYGGSMNEQNCEELLALPDINGGLIGGASLKSESFLKIIDAAEKILN